MGKSKTALPERWQDYKSIGNKIRGLPIIACKVPLKEEILRNKMQPENWFTPNMLVEMVPNVGCIVDLTATTRYYDPTVFTERGIRHAKIFCEGHVVPKSSTVQSFFQVVDEFLHNLNSRGKVLMVHCTHGLNRTGYLVSRYMVERRGFQPKDAIQAFNDARGHNIERVNYLQDLHRRKNEVCRNPSPLFRSIPHSGLVEQAAAAAGYDGSHVFFQGGQSSGRHNQLQEQERYPLDRNQARGIKRRSPVSRDPRHFVLPVSYTPVIDPRHFAPPASYSYNERPSNERPSSVTQPSRFGWTRQQESSGHHEPPFRRSNLNEILLHPPTSRNTHRTRSHMFFETESDHVAEVPSVSMQADPYSQPPLPTVENPPLTKAAKKNAKRQLRNQLARDRMQRDRSTPPSINEEQQKLKLNQSYLPSVAPESSSSRRRDRKERKSHPSNSSIEICYDSRQVEQKEVHPSNSSIEICYDSRQVDPSVQQKKKRSRKHKKLAAQEPEKSETTSSADSQLSGKKKRAKRSTVGAEASKP